MGPKTWTVLRKEVFPAVESVDPRMVEPATWIELLKEALLDTLRVEPRTVAPAA